jgi:hypothetical protein
MDQLSQIEQENIKQGHLQTQIFQNKPKIVYPYLYDVLKLDNENKDVRLLDQEDDMMLFHYIHNTPKENVYDCRGVVLEVGSKKDEIKFLCRSFPYTPEYLLTNDKLKNILSSQSFPMNVTCAYEGTILRLFYYEKTDRWYLSTHRKINGRDNRWSGPTFGELFDDCFSESDYSLLNKNYCYVFLLVHPGNKLVCSYDSPTIYHVATFTKGDSMVQVADEVIDHPSVKYPTRVVVNSVEELEKIVDSLDSTKNTGVIVNVKRETPSLFGEDFMPIKICNRGYYINKQIRGNEPNLRLRYLQLLRTVGNSGTEALRELYKDKAEYFDRVENDLVIVPDVIFNVYERRYLNNNYVHVNPVFHNLIIGLKKTMGTKEKNKEEVKVAIKNMINDMEANELNSVLAYVDDCENKNIKLRKRFYPEAKNEN